LCVRRTDCGKLSGSESRGRIAKEAAAVSGMTPIPYDPKTRTLALVVDYEVQ
jgi:hypothetical protein